MWNELVRQLKRLKEDESGVALMLTLSVVLLLFVLVSGAYSVGETVREKIELQNACDSAAYSAAVVQADGLSRMAMINRALSWTYVQLTNMQMDAITQRWLELVVRRFKEDRENCREWASNPRFDMCWSNCGKCKDWFKQPGNGWFCGVQGAVPGLRQNDYIKINGKARALSDLEQLVSSSRSMVTAYESAIPKLKELIRTLNGLHNFVNEQMQSSINGTILTTLYENLPHKSNGDVDEVLGRDYYWRRWTYAPKDPYPESEEDEETGYFSPLFNTEADEREFLSMSDGEVHENLLSYFQVDGEPKVAGGLDQWFIRSYAEETRRNRREFDPDEKSFMNRGICRVYKNANRRNTLKNADVMRGHHTGTNIDTAPSCINKKDYCAEQCRTIDDSVALYADWEWRSMKHSCVCVKYWKHFHWHYVHTALNEPLSDCDHVCCRGSSHSHSRSEYEGCCYVDTVNYLAHIAAAAASLASCSTMKQFLSSLAYPYGFGRVYGDDKDLFDGHEDLYIGEIAKPWILNDKFFRGDGSIIVALAKRQRNPWARLFGSDTPGVKGVQSAFNPNSDDSYLSAFAAARAAYHYRPSKSARAYGATEDGERSYETRYDAVCDNVRIESLPGMAAVGCVCGADNAKRYARCWNLCETDWDATLLPVRFAWAPATDGQGRQYDSLTGNEVVWSSATDSTPEYEGMDIFRSAAVNIVSEDGTQEGWAPFFDDSGTPLVRLNEDTDRYVQDVNLSRRIIHMYSPDRSGLFDFNGSQPAIKAKIL